MSHAHTDTTSERFSRLRGPVVAFAIAVSAALVLAGAPSAYSQAGGLGAPGNPQISDVTCLTLCIKPRVATVGSKIRVNGSSLDQTREVSFPTSAGKRAKDTRPRVKHSAAVLAIVKAGAISGPIRVVDKYGQTRDSSTVLKVGSLAQLRKVQKRYVFPVRGKHYYGDGLGAGRGHEGQDVMAKCGTKLIAAHSGVVIDRAKSPSSAAGNYLMIWDKKKRQTHVYMHMIKPAIVQKGDKVTTGTHIGNVGSTGRSSACHLHFEVRSGKKGWFGTPINPTKPLKYWDSYS